MWEYCRRRVLVPSYKLMHIQDESSLNGSELRRLGRTDEYTRAYSQNTLRYTVCGTSFQAEPTSYKLAVVL
jgi:hypothetical protein